MKTELIVKKRIEKVETLAGKMEVLALFYRKGKEMIVYNYRKKEELFSVEARARWIGKK